jgi:hypothetical protein
MWVSYYVRWAHFGDHPQPKLPRALVFLMLPLSAILIFGLLRTLASHDVREDRRYLTMYTAMGLLWVPLATRFFLPGISLRDDFYERGNASAGYAAVGFMVGSLLCFAGGNIGDGPGWWVVVFCAIIANTTLWALWLTAARFTRAVDLVTIDRDPALGMRLGGFFLACGLVLGRAVAGDWISLDATLRDFGRKAWPALILMVVYIGAERFSRARYHRDEQALFGRGVVPALFYVTLGLVSALSQGRIE